MNIELLKGSRFFQGLENEDLQVLVPLFTPREIPAGKTVFLENMTGESLYLVERGEIVVSKMLAEGDEQILSRIGPGEVFGELAILDGAPRMATSRVNSDAMVWRLERSDYERLCATHPATGLRLMRNLVSMFCQKLRDNNQDYREMILLGLKRERA